MFTDRRITHIMLKDPSKKKNSPDEADVTYECYACRTLCLNPQILREHMLTHSSVNSFKCPMDCKQVFSDFGDLKKHMHGHMSGKPCICFFCGQAFKNVEALDQHQCRKADSKLHSCPQCQKGFNDLSVLRKHLLSHSSEKPHLCPHCTKQYSVLEELQVHVYSHLDDDMTKGMCSKCNSRFHVPTSIITAGEAAGANSILKEDLCIVCTLESGYDIRQTKPYVCSHCRKGFVYLSRLEQHMLTHNKKYPHQCTYCCKQFKHKSAFDRHVLSHIGVWPYKCPHCSSGFSLRSNSNLYTSSQTGEISLRCPHCRRTFKTKEQGPVVKVMTSNLVASQRGGPNRLLIPNIHRCPICHAGFSAPSDLERHIDEHGGRTVHEEQIVSRASSSQTDIRPSNASSGINPLLCLHCGEEFTDLVNLEIHMAVHVKVEENAHNSSSPEANVEGLLDVNPKQELSKVHVTGHTHHSAYSQCFLCVQGFLNKEDLHRHLESHS